MMEFEPRSGESFGMGLDDEWVWKRYTRQRKLTKSKAKRCLPVK